MAAVTILFLAGGNNHNKFYTWEEEDKVHHQRGKVS